MAIYRLPKEKGYTQISNKLIESQELSVQEKWCLQFCLSRPDNWVFNIRGMSRFCAEGPDMVRSAIKGLEDKGYIVRQRERHNGKLGAMIYDIYEDPSLNPAYSVKARPGLEKPAQVDPQNDHPAEAAAHLLNTNQTNNDIHNIYLTNTQSINQGETVEDRIRRQIEYDIMCERYDSRMMDDLVAVMVSVTVEQNDTIAVSKTTTLPTDYVQTCVNKLNTLHIDQIIESLMNHQPVIHNMRGYLLTAMINAVNTTSMTRLYGDN